MVILELKNGGNALDNSQKCLETCEPQVEQEVDRDENVEDHCHQGHRDTRIQLHSILPKAKNNDDYDNEATILVDRESHELNKSLAKYVRQLGVAGFPYF